MLAASLLRPLVSSDAFGLRSSIFLIIVNLIWSRSHNTRLQLVLEFLTPPSLRNYFI